MHLTLGFNYDIVVHINDHIKVIYFKRHTNHFNLFILCGLFMQTSPGERAENPRNKLSDHVFSDDRGCRLPRAIAIAMARCRCLFLRFNILMSTTASLVSVCSKRDVHRLKLKGFINTEACHCLIWENLKMYFYYFVNADISTQFLNKCN